MKRIRELAASASSMDVNSREIKDLLEQAKMSPGDARQADRDYRKVMKFKAAVSHAAMDRALANLQTAERIFGEWLTENYATEKQRIAKLRTRDEIEKAQAVLEVERRRQQQLFDDEAAKFSQLDERRCIYASLMLKYPTLFPGETVWVDPRGKSRAPKERMFDACRPVPRPPRANLDADGRPPFDYTKLQLGGEPVYLVVDVNGRMLGDTEFGPLVFRRGAVAEKYTDTPKLAIFRITLTPHEVEASVKAFREAFKYLADPPPDSEWLYQIVPELQKLSRNEPFVADLESDYTRTEPPW